MESLPSFPCRPAAGKAHPPSRRASLQASPFPDPLPEGAEEAWNYGVTFDPMGPQFSP